MNGDSVGIYQTMEFFLSVAMWEWTTRYRIRPWYDQRDKITSVVIEEGITSITGAFCEHQNLREIVIPSSVKTIGRYTFDHF